MPEDRIGELTGHVQTRERLGGVLKFYYGKPPESFDPTRSRPLLGSMSLYGSRQMHVPIA